MFPGSAVSCFPIGAEWIQVWRIACLGRARASNIQAERHAGITTRSRDNEPIGAEATFARIQWGGVSGGRVAAGRVRRFDATIQNRHCVFTHARACIRV